MEIKPTTKPHPQNRLIIIGNGFDIANNLPTRYTDFIVNLLFHKFMKAFNNENGFHEDDYFVILKLHEHPLFNPVVNTSISEYLKFRNNTYYKIELNNVLELRNKIKLQGKHIGDIYFHVKDEFLNELFERTTEYNWVDIETEYYNKLLKITIDKNKNISYSKYSVSQLHKTFEMIQNELAAYLKTLKCNHFSQSIADIFDFPLTYDFKHRNRNKNDQSNKPKETLILNFNYTTTLRYYYHTAHWQDDFQTINIHGAINDPNNPIIFGYGDETDPSYKKLEDTNNNELLRFMKNKDYARTTNYGELISFIEQGVPFEVYILGHSCGLSDRVMLNTIFENEHCESIYIFYHQKPDGTDNFIETYHSISRQFSLEKRADLRKKVKAKSISMPFPQN